MLHNLGIELNQPVRQMHDLADRLRTQPDEEQQQVLLTELTAQSSSVLGLIENITLLTRLETQDWQPSRHPFSPSTLIDELLREALPSINQKDCRCSIISSLMSSSNTSVTLTRYAR